MKKLLVIFLLALPLAVQAQNSRVLYFMNLPQNRMLNPALRPPDSVNIALPMSGFGLNFNNNFLNFSDVITQGRGDSLITFLHPDYNTDEFLSRIRRQNSLDFEFMFQLLGLGFHVGRSGYLFFDINEKFQARTAIPGDIFELALKGNEPFAGDYIDLSALKADMRFYHEAGLGYSWNITPKLRAGVKGKLLIGMFSASFRNNSLGIRVNEDYTHLLDADVAMNFSAPVTIIRDAEGNIQDIQSHDESLKNTLLLKGKKNLGTAFDAGVSYDLTENIVLSAAITDLGMIRWKNNVTSLISKNEFEFSGIDLTDVINGEKTIEDVGQELGDSLSDAFDPIEMHEPYTTFLPAGLNIGGSYRLSKNFTLGVLSSSRFMGRQVKESLTMSANMNLGSSLLATLAYTASNHRFDNLGVGLALRLSIFQFYIMSDRIPVYWNKIYTDNGNYGNNGSSGSYFPVPANWNTVDLRFGMNLVFGHRKKKVPDVCEPVVEPGPEPRELEP
ncbi:MAG TPA: DUF5723 family protein [Bacteroidales bacterium]|nr:DUF5723 family protein [Bacteroidales bacterium]